MIFLICWVVQTPLTFLTSEPAFSSTIHYYVIHHHNSLALALVSQVVMKMVDDELEFIKYVSIYQSAYPKRLGTVKQGSIGFTGAGA